MLETLIAAFETIEDPRCEWKVEHRLLDILVIAVCAVLGEAESFEDIALYGRRTGRATRTETSGAAGEGERIGAAATVAARGMVAGIHRQQETPMIISDVAQFVEHVRVGT